MSYTPSVEEIREELEDQGNDISDDEWETHLAEGQDKYGEFGGDGFVAWATAYVEYGVKIDADYALPGRSGGSSDSGSNELPDDLSSYDIEDLNQVDYEDEEQIEVSGFVIDLWEDTSSNNNKQRKLRLRDETGSTTMMATGDSNVENFESANIESGDFVRFRGANVFHPEDSDYWGLSLPYWGEIDFPTPEYDLSETAKDYIRDVVTPGDFVYVSGLVTDTQFNEYEGCGNCMTKYDPDEVRVCPNCGDDEMVTYRPGRVNITDGDETATVSFSPSDPVPEEDILFQKAEALGEFEVDEYEGTEYREIAVEFFELLDDDADVSTDEAEEQEEETEEVEEETSTGDIPDEVLEIEEKVESFGYEMPAMAGIRVLEKSFGIEDSEEQIEMMKQVRDLDTVNVRENEDEGETIENEEWQSVMLEKAD